MKNKGIKIAAIALAFIAIVALGARITYVNVTAEKIIEEHYPMNTDVEVGDNFFFKDSDSMNGYTVNVKSAVLMTSDQFIEKHNLDRSTMLFPDIKMSNYVIDLEADFSNNGCENGIGLLYMTLNTEVAFCAVDDNLWSMIRPEQMGFLGFGIRDGQTKTIHIPYCYNGLEDEAVGFDIYKYLKNSKYQLVLSQYPVQKYIDVEVTTAE